MTTKGRIVGIDFGLKRIGMAISDDMRLIATPVTVVLAEKKSERTVQKIVDELRNFQQNKHYHIIEIVVGMPLMMNGKIGHLGDEVRHFVDLLRKSIDIPIVTWDERLSSVQADRSLREANMTRKQRAKNVDEVAAVIILQSYLDMKGFSSITSI